MKRTHGTLQGIANNDRFTAANASANPDRTDADRTDADRASAAALPRPPAPPVMTASLPHSANALAPQTRGVGLPGSEPVLATRSPPRTAPSPRASAEVEVEANQGSTSTLVIDLASAGHEDLQALANTLAAHTRLDSLTLCNARDSQVAFLSAALQAHRQLRALTLTTPIINSDTLARSVIMLYANNPGLRSFTLTEPVLQGQCHVSAPRVNPMDTLVVLYGLPAICKELTDLELPEIGRRGSRGLLYLAKALRVSRTLQTLHIRCRDQPPACIAAIAESLSQNANLHSLRFLLDYSSYRDEPKKAGEAGPGQPAATGLPPKSEAAATMGKADAVVRAVSNLPQLSSLRLCVLPAEGVTVDGLALAELVANHPRLAQLRLEVYAPLTDAASLYATLASSRSLREVHLQITEATADPIIELLDKATGLRALSLQGDVSVEIARRIQQACFANTRLLHLGLDRVFVLGDPLLSYFTREAMTKSAQTCITRNHLLAQVPWAGMGLASRLQWLPNERPDLPVLPEELYAEILAAVVIHLPPDQAQRVLHAFRL